MAEEKKTTLVAAADNYIAPIENDEGLDYINFSGRDIRDAFIAGAEWQKEQDEKSIDERWEELQINFREINEAFEAGKKWQKEQMLKGALDTIVRGYVGGDGVYIDADLPQGIKVNEGQKVKIIIVKSDD